MASQAERNLSDGLDALRHITQERDNLARLNRDWEVSHKALEAEYNLLRQLYSNLLKDSDRYKAYAVELRARLFDIDAVIQRAVQDARAKALETERVAEPEKPSAQTPNGGTDPIPRFLKQGPDQTHHLEHTVPNT